MNHTISVKELRTRLADIADQVENGESFTVVRRSKIAFKIVPASHEADNGQWETVIDFTEGGKKEGEKIEDVLNTLKKMRK